MQGGQAFTYPPFTYQPCIMKTTLKERMRYASDKLAAIAQKALKHPVSSIPSLCMLVGMATTITMYSQETGEKPAAVEATATMPVNRTITDTQGRSMDGTIVSKTDTAIKFRRTVDNKEFEIKIDTLSDADRTFIAGITAEEPKRPTVLLLVDVGTRREYRETVTLLRNNGFDVTIGVCPRRNAEDGGNKKPDNTFERISQKEKAILVSTLDVIDPYDILWIESFGFYSTEKGAAQAKSLGGFGMDLRPNHFELTNHHQKAKKLTVIRFGKNPKPHLFLEEGRLQEENDRFPNRKTSYYVKPHGKSWVFYYSGKSDDPHTSEELIHKSLIEAVKKQMSK